MRRLLADGDIRLSIAAQVLSTVGDNALWFALGVWIKILTGSSSAAGLSFFAFTLGVVCAPLGGVLIDRHRRRPTLVLLNLLGAAMILPLLLVHDRGGIWLVYPVMFGYGLMSGLIGGAQSALTQTIVPGELLASANGFLQALMQGLRLVTPLIGAGVLAAFGPTPLVLGDVATFVVAALLMCALKVREERPVRSTNRMRSQLTEGVRHIISVPLLRQLVSATALAIVAFGMAESVAFAVVSDGLHRPPAFLGVLNSVEGVGAIAASAAASTLMRVLGARRTVTLGLAGSGIGFLLTAARVLPVVLSGNLLLGASVPLIIVGVMTALQRGTPSHLMGRVDTALGIMVSGPQTVAIAVGAGLVAVVDFRLLLVAMTVVLLLAAAYLGTRRPEPEDPVPPAAGPPEAATAVGEPEAGEPVPAPATG